LSGYRDTRFSQDYKFRGSLTYLATSSLYETDANYRRSILIDKNGDKLDEYASPKDTEYSVRCIKVGSTSTNTASPATNTNATTTNNTSTSTANTNTSPATNNTITNTTSTATNTNTTTSTSGNLKCTRNGIEYLNGDVRCDGANQVRCDGGTFKQIYSCAADSDRICTENPTRTTNGNFFTSCKYRTQTFYTNGGNGSITGSVPEAEVATLKVNASYKCTLDMNTLKYGNCVYQSCAMGSHEEAGKCEYDTRACELDNSPNGGRQIWTSARGWGICQSIE